MQDKSARCWYTLRDGRLPKTKGRWQLFRLAKKRAQGEANIGLLPQAAGIGPSRQDYSQGGVL